MCDIQQKLPTQTHAREGGYQRRGRETRNAKGSITWKQQETRLHVVRTQWSVQAF